MISHEQRFIFVHIQKTGGKSILKGLGVKAGADHRTARQQMLDYGQEIWASHFKFAIVRNPWDRLVSAYFYRVQGGNGSPDDRQRASLYPRSFSRFCYRLEKFMTLPNERMFIPQWDWVSDENGELMIDFVGKLENIQTDFDVICDRIGVSKRQLAHTNKSKHLDFSEYYNSKTRDIVAQAYATDIEKFGYSFDAPVRPPGIIRNFLDQHL